MAEKPFSLRSGAVYALTPEGAFRWDGGTGEWVRFAVYPQAIRQEREEDWKRFHPEDFCHRCGQRNVRSWSSPHEVFNSVAEPHEIICPQCMSEAWEKRHGLTTWRIEPQTPKQQGTKEEE